MSHNGINIDQYILLVIYPSIAFFLIGFITKKKNVRKSITYIIQSLICFSFSIAYYLLIPHGGRKAFHLLIGSVSGSCFWSWPERKGLTRQKRRGRMRKKKETAQK